MLVGQGSYFSDNWNRMDGSLVMVGLVDTLASPFIGTGGTQNRIFGMLRLLRLFKVSRLHRPLRPLNR